VHIFLVNNEELMNMLLYIRGFFNVGIPNVKILAPPLYAGMKDKFHRLCMYSLGSFISITFGSGMETNIVIKES
jgi:hypothetical protein